jgi:hypothetical protein
MVLPLWVFQHLKKCSEVLCIMFYFLFRHK